VTSVWVTVAGTVVAVKDTEEATVVTVGVTPRQEHALEYAAAPAQAVA